MARLAIEIVDVARPGAAPVSEHSAFSAVARAVRAKAGVLPPVEPPNNGLPYEVSLGGQWRRLPLPSDPEGGESGTRPALPPADHPDWQRVFVPNNYGLEPSLSAHFGPVFYERVLPAFRAPSQLWFGAVDYLCDVWLAGRHLGRHEGYFAPFCFELDEPVEDGALLTVRVQDPFEDLEPALPFVLHGKRAIKGVLKYHDSRPGGLPGKHTPTWTPREGQSMTTGGIVGGVRLRELGMVDVAALFVTPLDAATGSIHVAVILEQRTAAPLEALLFVEVVPPEQAETTLVETTNRAPSRAEHRTVALGVAVPPGASRVDFEALLPDPLLWWPSSHADLGTPALYELRVIAAHGGRVTSERRTRFGLRTAEVSGDPKRLVLNGRPIFVQAVNYIPRQHFADADVSFYRRDMELVASLYLNGVGVHGHVQCPPCYDAADEAGIVVFQDFALQWHYDAGAETNPGFVERACRQIAEMAYALYDHPSIVYWACHNEPTAMFIAGMAPDPARDPDNQMLDAALEERLRSVDRSRHVHRASGIGDDLHLYDGSLMGGVVYDVRKHSTWFVSEFGFWTVGARATRWGDLRWPPDAAAMKEWHSRLSFAPSTFAFAGLPERYASLDAFRRATELYGSFLAKYQTEWIRSRRGAPFWAYRWHFFVDWWGFAGGGLLDVDREPKATYRALKAASRPQLVAASLPHTIFTPGSEIELPVFAVNEARTCVPLDVRWSVHRSDRSIVIGADQLVTERYSVPPPAPRSMIALPDDAPDVGPRSSATEIERGKFDAVLEPESAGRIGTVRFTLASEPFSARLLELAWGQERNYYYVLGAPSDWFCGPGAFVVSSDGSCVRLP